MSRQISIQRKRAYAADPALGLQPVHAALRSGAQPLAPAARAALEPRLGHDFSQVRIHADTQAAEAADAVAAHAFTVGQDIVFGAGEYRPETGEGLRLLAHELTHVVQQAAGPVTGLPLGGGLAVSEPGDRFEQEADRVADSVAGGGVAPGPARPALAAPSPATGAATIQRDDDEERKAHFSPIPPKLDLPLGPLDFSANTSGAQLGYTNPNFKLQLGSSYGGDASASFKSGALSVNAGVNLGDYALSLGGAYGPYGLGASYKPETGAGALNFSYDQFKLGANLNTQTGAAGLNLSYGMPRPQSLQDLGKTMGAGAQGLYGAASGLPGAFDDPIGYGKAHGGDFDAISKAYKAMTNSAEAGKTPSWGAGVGFNYIPGSPQMPEDDWRFQAGFWGLW